MHMDVRAAGMRSLTSAIRGVSMAMRVRQLRDNGIGHQNGDAEDCRSSKVARAHGGLCLQAFNITELRSSVKRLSIAFSRSLCFAPFIGKLYQHSSVNQVGHLPAGQVCWGTQVLAAIKQPQRTQRVPS